MLPILEVQNISKKFKIYHNKQPYLSLRDTIVDVIKHPSKVFQTETEEFWALKDVSFTVNEGESIGIIGKNGAGKSTLLKILSRITPPTKGKITLRGRVASLLEVGTGFHPELTGRENVYFNGAILGMKRSEIKRKFDEIVSFAGVEKFIDTPLKHYSSGMQLRLAFAVAAFLEAEILVVDEVLAVGDAEFQKKCLGKMEDITKKEGRTVLFVSHNMGAVQNLCSRGILLDKGQLIFDGKVEKVVDYYTKKIIQSSECKWIIENNNRIIDKIAYFKNIEIEKESKIIYFSDEIKLKINIYFKNKGTYTIGIGIDNNFQQRIFSNYHTILLEKDELEKEFIISLPKEILCPGIYFVSTSIEINRHFVDKLINALSFEILEDERFFEIYPFGDSYYGTVIAKTNWEVKN
jgi:lipopolysaccharide transport system ATP-binding protein